MNCREFRQALKIALSRHFPRANVILAESRGVVLTCRAELDADTFVAVYFNALTGKTSYALIRDGRRVVGYDNCKFWRHHPIEATDQHIACAEPTPEEAIAKLAAVRQN